MPLLSYAITAVYWLINIICVLIVIRSLLSWLPLGENNIIISFLNTVTEPVISPIRKLLFKLEFTRELPVDFSPMVAIILLCLISNLISQL